MWSKRLLVTCGALAALAVAFAIAGYFSGVPLVEWKMGLIGAHGALSEKQTAGLELATALLFMWPALSGIIAVVLHRWRRETDASVLAAIAYVAIPAVVLAGYIVLMAAMMSEGAAGKGSLHPSFTFTSLRPGIHEVRVVGFVSLCVWIYIGTRKPAKLGT